MLSFRLLLKSANDFDAFSAGESIKPIASATFVKAPPKVFTRSNPKSLPKAFMDWNPITKGPIRGTNLENKPTTLPNPPENLPNNFRAFPIPFEDSPLLPISSNLFVNFFSWSFPNPVTKSPID